MQVGIWRSRIEKEIEMCSKAWESFDEHTVALEELQRRLCLAPGDSALAKQVQEQTEARGWAYSVADRISVVLENLIARFEQFLQQADEHDETVMRIRGLESFHPLLTEEEMAAQEPIQFSTMTYGDFMEKFKKRFKEQRKEYDTVLRKYQPQKTQRPKYEPQVKMKQKLQDSDQISPQKVEEFKARILENVKKGVATEENPYKEHRQKIEGAKIQKILERQDEMIKRSKEQALQVATEVAERDYRFEMQLREAKQAEKDHLIQQKGFERNKRFIEQQTGRSFAELTANQYLQQQQQQFISKQANQRDPRFGLGIMDTASIARELKVNTQELADSMRQTTRQIQQAAQKSTDIENLLGAKLDRPKPLAMRGTRSTSQSRLGKQQKDAKQSGKGTPAPASMEEQISDQSDPEPEPPTAPAPLVPLKRHIPIMHRIDEEKPGSETGSRSMKVSQVLGKTGINGVQLVKEVPMKKVMVDVLVEDPVTGQARIVEREVDMPEEEPEPDVEVQDPYSTKRTIREQMQSTFKPTRDWQKVQDAPPVPPPVNAAKERLAAREVFVSIPETINFFNFEQFKEYEQEFLVTNNSATKQSFKVLEVEERFRAMLSFQYQQPGMLPPGQGVKIRVKFTYNDKNIYQIQDVITSLPIQHAQGVYHVPICCYQKAPKLQIALGERQALKQYEELRDPLKNHRFDAAAATHAAAVELKAMIDGDETQHVLFVNSGQKEALCRVTIAQMSVDGSSADMLAEEELARLEKEAEAYVTSAQLLESQIRQEYEVYLKQKEAVDAPPQPKKPATPVKKQQPAQKKKKEEAPVQEQVQLHYDFTQVPAGGINDFVGETVIKQLGSKPAAINQNIRQFRKVYTIFDALESSKLLAFERPQIVQCGYKKFDPQKARDQLIAEFRERAAELAAEKLQAEEEAAKKDEGRSTTPKVKAKRSKTPDKATSPLPPENASHDEKLQQLASKILDDLQSNMDVERDFLKAQKESDVSFVFTVPEQAVLKLPFRLKPLVQGIEHVSAAINVEQLSVGGRATLSRFQISTDFQVFTSPVFLGQKELDFDTCFYGQNYSAVFDINLRNSLQNVSRIAKITVPKALSSVLILDQNDVLLNNKQPQFKPKLTLTFKNKLQLAMLRDAQHESWSALTVSQFDQYFDSVVPLGADVAALHERLNGTAKELETVQKELRSQEDQKIVLEQKLSDAEAILAQPLPKGQKAHKLPVPMDELRRQYDVVSEQILNLLKRIEAAKKEIQELKLKADSDISLGSYLELCFNLHVSVSQQPEILYLPVKARFTTSDISSDLPSALEIDRIPTQHISCFPVSVTNRSALSQHVAVLLGDNQCLRKDFQAAVEPHGGVDLLFPGQTRKFTLKLLPNYEARAQMNIRVAGEYGSTQTCVMRLEARDVQVQVVNPEKELAEISVNDSYQKKFALRNTGAQDVNYTVCPAFSAFIQNELDGFVQLAPAGETIKPGTQQQVSVFIETKPSAVQKLLLWLENNSREKDGTRYQFFRHIVAGTTEPFGHFVEMTIPIYLSTGDTISYCTKFLLRGPIVSLYEPGKAVPVPPSPQPAAGKKSKPPTPTKSRKNIPIAQPVEEPKQEEVPLSSLNIKDSKITVDFGQQPLGSATLKEVDLLLKGVTAYIQELSVPFFDADIEFKSAIHKKLLKDYKAVFFEFTPRKTGVQREVFDFVAWADPQCVDKKLNQIQIECVGEGVEVQVNAELIGQVPTLTAVNMELSKKELKQLEKKGPNIIQTGLYDVIRHYVKPLQVGQSILVQLNLKKTSSFIFSCTVEDHNRSKSFKSFIYGERQLLDADVKTVEIEIVALQETRAFETLHFTVNAGNYSKNIEIVAFCTNTCQFAVLDEQYICCAAAAAQLEFCGQKVSVQAGKYEVLKNYTVGQEIKAQTGDSYFIARFEQ